MLIFWSKLRLHYDNIMSVALTMPDTTDMVLAVRPVKFLYNCEGNKYKIVCLHLTESIKHPQLDDGRIICS